MSRDGNSIRYHTFIYAVVFMDGRRAVKAPDALRRKVIRNRLRKRKEQWFPLCAITRIVVVLKLSTPKGVVCRQVL